MISKAWELELLFLHFFLVEKKPFEVLSIPYALTIKSQPN